MSDAAPSSPIKAAIVGCAGTTLIEAEKTFFRATQPLGFILFKRNCESPAQVKALVSDLRHAVDREDAPVLVDQEGGRVQRMGPPHWPKYPAQQTFAKVASDKGLSAGVEAATLNATLIGMDLAEVGITVNCLPLLDVPADDGHDIIGDRAYGPDPEITTALGQGVIDGLMRAGVLPIIKHIPGHGRARVDSHLELPTVDAAHETLSATDFAPFRALASAPWAMTAHIVYTDIDPAEPATLSKTVIDDVIRRDIGFDGFLVSDDLTMKALAGTPGDLAKRAVDAGCDAVLHCDGELEEMQKLMPMVPPLSVQALHRLSRHAAVFDNRASIDRQGLQKRMAALIRP